MKEQLKGVPIFGWAFQMLMYVFLKRGDRAQDISWIRRVMSYLARSGTRASLLLFPEGTDWSPRTLADSIAWAQKNGKRAYQHVLHPRVGGFVETLRAMRSQMDAVYDVTLAFVYNCNDNDKPRESSLLTGRYPPQIHMFLRRTPIADVPMDETGLEKWCREREFRFARIVVEKADGV